MNRLVVCQHSRRAGLGASHISGLPERNQRWFGSWHFQNRRRSAQTHTSTISLSAPTPKAALMLMGVRRCCLVGFPFPGSLCFNKLHTRCKTHQTHFIRNVQLLPARFFALLVCFLNLSFFWHCFAPFVCVCVCMRVCVCGLGDGGWVIVSCS